MLNSWFYRREKLPRERQESLPEGLRSRLKALPRATVLCRDVDRQWAELLTGELDPLTTQDLESHGASCPRCGHLLAAFVTAREDREPIPGALETRLRVTRAVRRPAPWWVIDVRFAVAASYLVALVAVPAFGLVSDRTAEAEEAVREKAQRTVEELERGNQAVVTTVTAVTTGFGDQTKKALAIAGDAMTSIRKILDRQDPSKETKVMSEDRDFPEKE